jgi:transposase
VRTTRAGLAPVFGKLPKCRVVMEAGSQTRWIAKYISAMGHEVKVADPRRLRRIYESDSKSDVNDARELSEAALDRWDRLPEVRLRSEESQKKLSVLKTRNTLVKARTALVNTVRAIVKQYGAKVRKCEPEAFPKRASEVVPEEAAVAVEPLLEQITLLTKSVKELDRWVEAESERDVRIQALRKVPGVGLITAAAYVWTLDDPYRFKRSRSVGAYLGLRPKRDQSGETDKQLHITKAGNRYLRALLVSVAQGMMRKNAKDTALKQFGLRLAQRGGKRAKKIAAVAMARKLAVLLHHLWVTGEVYEAFPQASTKRAA